MVCDSTIQKHSLCRVSSEAAPNQDISRLHEILVDVNDIYNSLGQTVGRELLQKHRIHVFLVKGGLVTESWDVLAVPTATDPHKRRRNRALQISERVRAIGEEAKAIFAHISDLPLVGERHLNLLLTSS